MKGKMKILPASIEQILVEVKKQFKEEPKIYQIFENCYTNTLDTTVKSLEDGTSYVIT